MVHLPLGLAAALLAAAPLARAAAFSPGNLLVSVVGDGTLTVPLAGASSTAAVALSLVEFSTATLSLAPTGNSVTMPTSAAAAAAAGVTSMLTVPGEAADFGGPARAYSGKITRSWDGQYACVTGLNATPGTAFSAQSQFLPNPIVFAPPSPIYNRVIACVDANGAYATMQSVSTQQRFWAATDVKTVYYYNGGTTPTPGFYIAGGATQVSADYQQVGGLVWMPTPGGITVPAAVNSSVWIYSTGSSVSSTSQAKITTDAFVYQGQLHGTKVYLAGLGSSTELALLGSGTPVTAVSTSSAGLVTPNATTGWDFRSWQFVPLANGAGLTAYAGDASNGLQVFQCTNTTTASGTPPVTRYPISACAYWYSATLPNSAVLNSTVVTSSSSGNGATNNVLSVALVTVAGTPVVAITLAIGVFLWPQANTGAYVSSTGTCCANSAAGACCWLNGGAPVLQPGVGKAFRSAILAPQFTLCAAGTSGAPGACTKCAAGSFTASAGAATCSTCPSDAKYNSSSTLTGQTQCACAAGYVWDASSLTCVTAPPCVAGSTWSALGVAPCAACGTCSAGRTVVSACNTTANTQCSCSDGGVVTVASVACSKCNANFIPTGSGATFQCLCPSGFSTSAGSGPDKQCFAPCTAGTYSLVAGGTCVACPTNGVSGADARTCTCGANSTSNGLSGAALVCTACPSNAVSLGGSSACSCLGFWDSYDPVNNVCITPPSATASVTPSPTSSPTSTISVTPSNTGSNTPSLTRTPSRKSTPRKRPCSGRICALTRDPTRVPPYATPARPQRLRRRRRVLRPPTRPRPRTRPPSLPWPT